MIGELQFVLLVSLLLGAARGDLLLDANDAQTCTDLCTSCEGTATFVDGRCECLVADGNKSGIECIKRMKRETEKQPLDLDAASSDLGTAERSARCSLLGSRKRLGSADADRVAKYFMNGGPLTGSSLLGRSNADCSSSSSKDQYTGASNPNAVPARSYAEPEIQQPIAQSPVVVGAAAPSSLPCSSGSQQYQPIVSTQWLPNYGMGYNRGMLGAAHQPLQGGYYNPYGFLGAVPHVAVLAIPQNALMRATHIPALHPHPSAMLAAAPHHSPLLSALASGTHGILERLDNVISPYANPPARHGNIVGATHDSCAPSSYSSSNIVGAQRATPGHSQNPALLQQVLARQNSLLEALSSQLQSYHIPHVEASRMQYAPLMYHPLGAANPMMGQQQQQCYCPDHGSSSMLGAANPNSNASDEPAKTADASPAKEQLLTAPNPMSSSDAKTADEKKSTDDSDDAKKKNDNADDDDDTATLGAKAPQEAEKEETAEEKAEQKTKRESRLRSSTRRKRGDVKYYPKKLTQ